MKVTKKTAESRKFPIFSPMLDLALRDVTFSVVDVETTGIRPTFERVIEIGIVRYKNGEIIDSYQSFVNPGRAIPQFIAGYTGITDDMVEDAPFFEEIATQIRDMFAGTVVCGHNLQFDLGFLRAEFQRAGMPTPVPVKICTLKLARRMYPMLRSKSLSSVAMHLKIRSGTAHRAIYDAETTARVLDRIIFAKLNENPAFKLSDLVQFESGMIKTPIKLAVNQNLLDSMINLPDSPGVYYFLDAKNNPIYIGKAKSLKERLRSYFAGTAPSKSKKLLKSAKKLRVELCNTELTAFLTEAEMIKKLKPKHNVMLKSYGNKYYLRFKNDTMFPRPEIVNKLSLDGNDYFGMFISRRKAEQVLTVIDKAFRMRECNDKEFSKKRTCYLADIDRCTAPCENKETDIYNEEIRQVFEFLEGKDTSRLNELLQKMKRLAEALKFEEAGNIKTVVELMLAQIQKSSLLSEPVNKANILIVVNEAGKKDMITFLNGRVFIKDYILTNEADFFEALDDYFAGTIQRNVSANEEDLEKLKISMNWMVKNKNSIKIYYLKEFSSAEELFAAISMKSVIPPSVNNFTFNITSLTDSMYERNV